MPKKNQTNIGQDMRELVWKGPVVAAFYHKKTLTTQLYSSVDTSWHQLTPVQQQPSAPHWTYPYYLKEKKLWFILCFRPFGSFYIFFQNISNNVTNNLIHLLSITRDRGWASTMLGVDQQHKGVCTPCFPGLIKVLCDYSQLLRDGTVTSSRNNTKRA